MKTKGKSTLLGSTGKLVGFGFGSHPIKNGWFLNVVIYRVGKYEYAICLSEGEGKGNPDAQRESLGQDVPGESFARYAVRGISGVPFTNVKKIIGEEMPKAVPGLNMEWLEE